MVATQACTGQHGMPLQQLLACASHHAVLQIRKRQDLAGGFQGQRA